ncbi:MAG TPA: hypothetical protein VFG10_01875 [Saprospiraceae bacterium]|nr:hypothetical protein [Saprospiraceae bacterium]
MKFKTLINWLLTITALITPLTRGISQIDTLKLKFEINALTSEEKIQTYLNRVFKMDQTYRSDRTKIYLDLERLISISYFINKYGYPTKGKYGLASNAPRLVWIHNKFHALRKLAFPIILKGFQANEIDEKEIRTYYLKNIYQSQFYDTNNVVLPLDELFQILELNVSNTISIKELILNIDEIKKLNSIQKKDSRTWDPPTFSKEVLLNGVRTPMTYKGDAVEIFTLQNCKIYFQKLYADHSAERKELIKIGEDQYKYKGRETDKYFEVNAEGDLLYRNKEMIITTYKKHLY